MGAVDPTYPLYPIACILSSVMLLLVLSTGFVRQSWNFGVALLCFWLLLENVSDAVSAIVWFDNADVNLYVYCDIVSHLQVITFVVKPMATLIITRRLYLIAHFQSVELPSKAARRWDLAVEWILGLIIPILVAGPLYYVNQGFRFEIDEGFGCANTTQPSILELLIEHSWAVIPPLVSIVFYYPKVARTFYRQRRDINSFLSSNPSVSRTNYSRILILASLDILLTLPSGVVSITLSIIQALSVHDLPFYPGWTFLHTNWEPPGFSYAGLQAEGTSTLAQFYYQKWTSPVLAFIIFGLFGVTPEARASYWRIVRTIVGWFGWKPTLLTWDRHASLGEIEFGARPHDAMGFDLEMGSHTQGSINTDVYTPNQGARHTFRSPGCAACEETEKANEEACCGSTSDIVSQNSIKNRVQTAQESSDVVEISSVRVGSDVPQDN